MSHCISPLILLADICKYRTFLFTAVVMVLERFFISTLIFSNKHKSCFFGTVSMLNQTMSVLEGNIYIISFRPNIQTGNRHNKNVSYMTSISETNKMWTKLAPSTQINSKLATESYFKTGRTTFFSAPEGGWVRHRGCPVAKKALTFKTLTSL